MSEKLCLQWNDFKENVNSAFGSLREDNEFADVTLACEDGQQIEAHKVILAASSPFFQNLLKRNRHPHLLIYMRGIKSENMLAIVDFLYCGEANVYQENLDSFLAIAEELRLKGLMGNIENVDQNTENNHTEPTTLQVNTKPVYKREKLNLNTEQVQSNLEPRSDQETPNDQMNNERRISTPNLVSRDLQDLDAKVKSMIEKTTKQMPSGTKAGYVYICNVCGKEGAGTAIRDHIEANHLEGVSLPCSVCEKTFRSRALLRKHKCVTRI